MKNYLKSFGSIVVLIACAISGVSFLEYTAAVFGLVLAIVYTISVPILMIMCTASFMQDRMRSALTPDLQREVQEFSYTRTSLLFILFIFFYHSLYTIGFEKIALYSGSMYIVLMAAVLTLRAKINDYILMGKFE